MTAKDKFTKMMEKTFRDTFVNNPKVFKSMCECFNFTEEEPAKKEMLSAEELAETFAKLYIKDYKIDYPDKESIVEIITLSAENRDILYADLMEAVEVYLDGFVTTRPNSQCCQFRDAINKINSVIDPDKKQY